MGRAKERENHDAKFHFWLLDEDSERTEATVVKMAQDISDLKKIGLGILTALSTASIVLVATRLTG